jgi:hypothetical protein
VARRGSDIQADRPQDDIVGLAILELAREGTRIDGLVVVAVGVGQAGWKTRSMRDGRPRARSSSS